MAAAGAMLSLALLLPGAASARANPPLVWTAPVLVSRAPFANGSPVPSVSCPSRRLCVAGDSNGNVITSTDPGGRPATWTPARIPDARSLEFMNCPSTRFCLALSRAPRAKGPFQIFTSVKPAGGPGAWVAATAHPPIRAISCPSRHLCVVGDAGKIIVSTNPAAGARSVWKVTATWPALRPVAITGIACPNVTFCVAVDQAGNVYSSSDPAGRRSAWKIVNVAGAVGLHGVTCPSPSFCASKTSRDRMVYSSHPAGGASAWHQVTVPARAVDITCLSARFCLALDDGDSTGGNLMTTTNPAGGVATWQSRHDDRANDLTGLSCATTTLCAAVDRAGHALTSDSPAGGKSAWKSVMVSGYSPILSLDCPAAAFCAAEDYAGNILTSTAPGGDFADWRSTHVNSGFDAISCPAPSLCVGAGRNNGSIVWSTSPAGGAAAWSAATIDGSNAIVSISCPTTSLCVAADSAGNVLSSTDPAGGAAAWRTASVARSALGSVTCPSASLCLASGTAAFFTSTNPAGRVWRLSAEFPVNSVLGPIDCPTTSFCAAIGLYQAGPSDIPAAAILTSRHPTRGAADWQVTRLGRAGHAEDGPGGIISCPSASFCLAQFSDVVSVPDMFASADPASGQASAWVHTGVFATAVSCGSQSLCVTGNGFGQVRAGTSSKSAQERLEGSS